MVTMIDSRLPAANSWAPVPPSSVPRLAFFVSGLAAAFASAASAQPEIRIGMIGLDTSHVTVIASRLNDPASPNHVAGARVVCAVPGGSPDVEMSRTRVAGYTAELRDKYGVRIVGAIPELLDRCDAVMIMSVDGRPHLAEARAVFGHGKPVFIDKPLAASLADAKAIVALGKETRTPFFSASAFRFSSDLAATLADPGMGGIRGAVAYGNGTSMEHMGPLFFEGIHTVEALCLAMGSFDCQSVSCVHAPDAEAAIGTWPGDRVGVLYAVRNGRAPHDVILFGRKKVHTVNFDAENFYGALTQAVVHFFQTRAEPFPPEQTLRIIAFMEAADRSRQMGGCPVPVAAP
jgi:hypothetical protein